MNQNDMPKGRIFKANVIVIRKDHADRVIPVRISWKTMERMGIEESGSGRHQAARNRAAEVMYGRGCRFQSDAVPHRGKVWTSAKGGGSNAVTDALTMRIE